MYPDAIILDFDLYTILSFVGIFLCLLLFKLYINEKKMPNKVFNFFLLVAVGSIVIGYFFAMLFQAIFNFIKSGRFSLLDAGMTFYGGLFGGIVAFLGLFFGAGAIVFKEKEHFKYFNVVLQVAPCSITLAHAFGRIGCLFAGCCHGKISDGPLTIRMWVSELNGYYNCVPIQLYEAIFLLALCGFLSYLYFKNIHFEMELYCILYGVWRFVIEFFRADDRGEFFSFLTPSQAFAILFVLAGVGLFIFKRYFKHKKQEKTIE